MVSGPSSGVQIHHIFRCGVSTAMLPRALPQTWDRLPLYMSAQELLLCNRVGTSREANIKAISLIAITPHQLIMQYGSYAAGCSFLHTTAGRNWINQKMIVRIQMLHIIIPCCESQAIHTADISIWDQPEIWSKILPWQVDHISLWAWDGLLGRKGEILLFPSFLFPQISLDLSSSCVHRNTVFKDQSVSSWWGCDSWQTIYGYILVVICFWS
jgi:hypothetical protein